VPGGHVERPPGPSSDLPRLPDESLKEYIFRTDADEREATARSRLWAAIAAFDPAAPLDANGQTALQAELQEIAFLLDEARQLREFGERARIEAVADTEGPPGSLPPMRRAPTDSSAEAEAPTDSSAEAAPLRVEEPGRETPSTSGGDGTETVVTETVVTIASAVALLTAIAGLVAAVAGLFTALATWIKARRQPASTDTSANG